MFYPMIVKALLIAGCLFVKIISSANAAPATGDGTHGIVVSSQHLASEAGRRILEAGGNAVDAAVAVGYALAVVEPCCGNIGGGGFMLVRRPDGRTTMINFREKAPLAATPDMYLDLQGNPIRDDSTYGYKAAAVPGTVMGLERALGEYGRLGRAAVMAPAIALARDGFILDETDAANIAGKTARLGADPAAAPIFLHPDATPYRAGERLVQSDLAATLTQIADRGADAFYRGAVADAVADASAANRGLMTREDFANFTASESEPVSCAYRGYRIVSASLPSSGGTILCEMLNVLSGWNLGAFGYHSAESVHLIGEAMRRAFVDRNSALGDPDFVPDRHEQLLSAVHADEIRAAINIDKATPSAALGQDSPTREKPQTTHYSVVDREGYAVSVTFTLNGNFGSAVVAPGTGVLLNNEMDDFSVKPGAANLFGLRQGNANAIAPAKRPLSSMTPTIVERDGKPVLVLGSPGGPRIITAVLETILNIIDFGLSPADAVAAPRFHHQWLPDTLYYEKAGLPADTIAGLTARGHRLTEQSHWGAVALIAIAPDGHMTGVNDPRRPGGAAAGY